MLILLIHRILLTVLLIQRIMLLIHWIMLTVLLIHRTARFIQKPLILNWKKFLLCFSGQMRF